MELSQFDAAESEAQALIKQHPEKPLGYERFAQVAQRRLQWDKALQRWEQALTQLPVAPPHFYGARIQCLMELSQFDAAESEAQALIKQHPEKPLGYVRFAQVAQRRLQWDKALQRWEHVIINFARNKPAYSSIGHILLSNMEYYKAKRHYDELMVIFSDDKIWANNQYGLFLERVGFYKKAIKHIESNLKKYPENIQLKVAYARNLFKNNDDHLAEDVILKIIADHPYFVGAFIELISIKKAQGKTLEALSIISEFSEKINAPNVLIHKMNCHLLNNDFDAATQVLGSLQVSSKVPELTDRLTNQVEMRKKWTETKLAYDSAKNFPDLNEKFMSVLRISNNHSEVEQLKDYCKAKLDNESWFDHYYAKWLSQHGKPKEALLIWEKLLLNDMQRSFMINIMKAASIIGDYEYVNNICFEYANYYPMNTIVKSYFDKSCLWKGGEANDSLLEHNDFFNKVDESPKTVSFLHSGDLGDIIFAMPLFKRVGNINLYITTTNVTREAMRGRTHLIEELILSQSYINEVKVWNGEVIDFDLTEFRDNAKLNQRTLTDSQSNYLFGDGFVDGNKKWLDIREVESHNRVVFARSFRYRNPNWENLWPHFKEMYPNAIFLGLESEYKDFGSVEFIPTKNLYDVAKIIAGSSLFISNQSAPQAIAEGLKVNRILEACHYAPVCSFFDQSCSLF